GLTLLGDAIEGRTQNSDFLRTPVERARNLDGGGCIAPAEREMIDPPPRRPLRQAFHQIGREALSRLIAGGRLLRQKLEQDGGDRLRAPPPPLLWGGRVRDDR